MSRDKPSLVSRLPKFGYGGAAKSRGPDDAAAAAASDDGDEKRSRPSLASAFGFRGKKNDVARRPTAGIAAAGEAERREAEPAPRAAPDADAANGGPGSDDRGAARPPPVRSPPKPRVARQAFGFAGPARTTRAPVRSVAEELREASEDRHRARSSSDCERCGAGDPGECRSRTESIKSEAGSSSSLGDDGFPPETALTRAQSFSHALASPATPASTASGQLQPLAGRLQRSKSMSKALQAQPGHGGAASRHRFGRPNNASQPNLAQAGRTRPRGAVAARPPGPLRGPARSSPADADEASAVASFIPSSALRKPRLPGFAAPGANGRAAAGRGGPLAAKPASPKPSGAPGAGIGARAEPHAGGRGGGPNDVTAADGGGAEVQVDSESPPEEADRSETASLRDSESSETIAPLHGDHGAVCHDTVLDPAEVTGSDGGSDGGDGGDGGGDDGKAGDADDPVDRSDADPAGDGEEAIGRGETDGSGGSVDRNSPDASRRQPSCELDDDDLMLELDFPDEASLLAAAAEAEGTDGVRAAEMRGHGRGEARREARSHWRSHGGRSVDGGTSAAVASPGAGIPPRATGGPHARSPAPPGETAARDGSAGATWRSERGDGGRFFPSNANAAGTAGAGLDPAFLRHLVQDCTGMKTLLLKLKRALQEDEELVSGSRTQTSLNCQSEGQEKTHDKDAATDEVTRLRGQLRAREEENARLKAELARLRPDGVAGPDGVAEPGAAATEEKSTQTERRRRSSLKPSPPPSAQGSSATGNPQRPALTGDPSDANGAAPPRAAEGAREAACREDEPSALLSAKLRIDGGDGVGDAPPVAGRPSGRFTVAQHRACRPPWPQHGHRGHGHARAPPGPPPVDEPRAPFVSGDERPRRGDPPDAAAPSVAVRPRPLAWDAPGVPPGVAGALPGHPAAPVAAIPGRQTHRPAALAGERGPPPGPPGTREDAGAFPAAPGAPGGAWGQHAVPSAGAGRGDAETHRGAEGSARPGPVPGPVPRHGRRATGPQSRLPKPRS